MELLIIGGALMLIVGPAAAPKLLKGFQSMKSARGLDKLTKANEALDALTGGGDESSASEEDAEEDDAVS
jgi:hypothetical protein